MAMFMVTMSDEMHKELLLLKRVLGKSGAQIIREGVESQIAVNKSKIDRIKKLEKVELEKEN